MAIHPLTAGGSSSQATASWNSLLVSCVCVFLCVPPTMSLFNLHFTNCTHFIISGEALMRLEEQKLSTCWAGESLSVMLQKKKDVFFFLQH